MLFLFQSYSSGTDIISEIQILSPQRSEVLVRKPVLFNPNWKKSHQKNINQHY